MSDDLNDLYQQVILDHCKSPRNLHALEGANRKGQGRNPLCGDNYTVFLKMDGDVVRDISFQGSGCCISKASASLLTTAVKGKTKAEVRELFDKVHDMITTGKVDEPGIGKLAVFAGVHKFPARVKCAILSWHAVMAALEGKNEPVSTESADGSPGPKPVGRFVSRQVGIDITSAAWLNWDVTHGTHMKTIITALFSLLAGFALGWYFGYVQPNTKANREAMRQFAISDADDSMAAFVAYRTFKLYDAGKTQKAMQSLAWPIGVYYRFNKKRPLTEERSNFLGKIERLASTNQIVATEIHRKIE